MCVSWPASLCWRYLGGRTSIRPIQVHRAPFELGSDVVVEVGSHSSTLRGS